MGRGSGACGVIGCMAVFIVLAVVAGVVLLLMWEPDQTADRPNGQTPAEQSQSPSQTDRPDASKTLRLTQGTPLEPAPGGVQVGQQGPKTRFVNSGGTVTLLESTERNGVVWHRVSARDAGGKAIGEGWIRADVIQRQRVEPVAPGQNPADQPAEAPRIKTTTLIGSLFQDEDGRLRLKTAPDPYDSTKRIQTYLLDAPEPAQRVFQSSGGQTVDVIVIGQILDDQDPPRLKVISATRAPASP